MFELFITDLDGTLLDDQKNISAENLEAIGRLRSKGIKFTVFTGRNFSSAVRYLEELEIDGLVALQNGAIVMDFPTRRILSEIGLNSSIAGEIYLEAKERNLFITLFARYNDIRDKNLKDMYTETHSWTGTLYENYFEHNRNRISIVDSLIPFIDTHEEIGQFAIIGDVPHVKVFQDKINATYGDQITSVSYPMPDGSCFLEVLGSKVSKGNALEPLLEEYNTTASKTVFIGDNFNDLPLMRKVGLPVATDNALREIKDHCKMIVADNNHHAVKETIEKIFFD
ncbi:MAG TPA: Cof-type HAD-IIB family hydrolase [Thermotogota bacterium]|nr:Cof-type HAD-IIB family hydrolase [Thermotogota bacterium]HPJ88936.1 Cof-type HAD-IIB family hydrolase [Thermotogota bacterium]HPR95316.1 Cof-type HAD-IIB family hydrolase [Thermotogota bacterium]